jgi:hypothetical protein
MAKRKDRARRHLQPSPNKIRCANGEWLTPAEYRSRYVRAYRAAVSHYEAKYANSPYRARPIYL